MYNFNYIKGQPLQVQINKEELDDLMERDELAEEEQLSDEQQGYKDTGMSPSDFY